MEEEDDENNNNNNVYIKYYKPSTYTSLPPPLSLINNESSNIYIPQYDGLDSDDSDEEGMGKRRIRTRASTSKELESDLSGHKVRLIETDTGIYKVKGIISNGSMYTNEEVKHWYIRSITSDHCMKMNEVSVGKWIDGEELEKECIELKYIYFYYYFIN